MNFLASHLKGIKRLIGLFTIITTFYTLMSARELLIVYIILYIFFKIVKRYKKKNQVEESKNAIYQLFVFLMIFVNIGMLLWGIGYFIKTAPERLLIELSKGGN